MIETYEAQNENWFRMITKTFIGYFVLNTGKVSGNLITIAILF